FQCWNFGQTNEIRHLYLIQVNELRSKLGLGTASNKNNTMCPAGKNIYRLNWDCILENYAQKAVDQCVDKPKLDAKVEETLSMVHASKPLTTCNPTPLFKEQVKEWWSDVEKVGLNENAAFETGLENFAVLANGLSTRIGCAQKNCNGVLHMACMVYGKAATTGQAIYEVGKSCEGDYQCTTFKESKCLKKKGFKIHCFLEHCDSTQDEMNRDPAREELLKVHNQIRAATAKGEVMIGKKNKTRQCPRMKKFQKYNCDLEKKAWETAKDCSLSAEPKADNVNWFMATAENRRLAAIQAMGKWFNETETGSLDQQTGSQNLLLPKFNIAHFARMVWDTNADMGCAVANCGGKKWNVVCQYGQGVGKPGNQIYFMGPTCNQCKTTCVDGGLCP
ncbi:SCP-like protein, partial [Ancylostoma caninum]